MVGMFPRASILNIGRKAVVTNDTRAVSLRVACGNDVNTGGLFWAWVKLVAAGINNLREVKGAPLI